MANEKMKDAVDKAVAHYLRQGIPFAEITPEAVGVYLRNTLGFTHEEITGHSVEESLNAFEEAIILWRAQKLGLPPPKADPNLAESIQLSMEGFERDRWDEDPRIKERIAQLDAYLVRLYRENGWIDDTWKPSL